MLGRIFREIIRDRRGATVIEYAFALPVLVMLMIGILQFALILQASGAMRHGIGEGLRYAKVNPDATESEVLAQVRPAMGGVDLNNVTSLRFTSGTTNGVAFGRITMQYEMMPVIPFAPLPAIQLSETRTTFLPL